MHKALDIFNLNTVFKIIQKKDASINDISEDINSNEKSRVIICRTPNEGESFEEPQNVSLSPNILKPSLVKVYCEEYLQTIQKKDAQIFKQEGNVFHLALVTDKENVEQPKSKVIKENVKIDPTQDAKDLVDSLVNGKMIISV